MKPELIQLPTFRDGRGNLTVMEKEPFDLKRVFWIYGMKGWRGGHAHRDCHQLMVPVYGSVEIRVNDKEYWLLDPSAGLHIPPGNNIEYRSCNAAVVLVLCSEYFDKEDYVRSICRPET